MAHLPVGTVTFLFTDVEGSTRLLEQLGDGYHAVQDRHTAILREAISSGGGSVVNTEGDSFFGVFPDAGAAVAAAVQAQRQLASEPWPRGIGLRVRMGLHTGAGVLGGDDYLGLDVNRAARIAAAAHGGQVLVSDTTQTLVERCLPGDTRLRKLGLHRFKNLTEPEHVYQIVIDGLEQDFLPPRTLDARPNNLPIQLTEFIGRTTEITRVRELLVANRLLTLTGTGGTGKTRLALQVASAALDDFADGVFFVDLSAIEDDSLVSSAIAKAIGVRADTGQVQDVVVDSLAEKNLLLVMDNFEQVLGGAALALDPLLRRTAGVSVLVTSRVPLGLYGEQQFHVPPLALPDLHHLPDVAAFAQLESVALFVERALAVKPDFSLTIDNARAVAEIISRVDGLPLAIELAASRVKLLPPERLLARLQERLPLLTTTSPTVPERQRTLRRTIEWSHELLAATHRRVFARLAVFSGGADLDAVEAVVSPGGELSIDILDALNALLEINLVRSVETDYGDVRFTMLETIREYGLERLAEDGEEPQIRRRHAEHWITFAGQAAPALAGADQAIWTRRVEGEQENLRSAFAWAVQAEDADLALRLGAALPELWRASSRVRDGVRWLNDALALPGAAGNTLLRARALASAGQLYGWIDDPQPHLRLAEEALATFQALGETDALPASLQMLGWAQLQNGLLADAARNLGQARDLYVAMGNRPDAAESAMGLGIGELMQGRAENARPLYQEALRTFRDLGNTYFIGLIHCMLAQCDTAEGDLAAAETAIRAGLAAFQQSGNLMGVAWTLYQFAYVADQRGQHERALRLVGASESLLELVGGELPALVVATTGDVGAAARAALDTATAARATQEGSALQYEDAVAYAFQEGDKSPSTSSN